MRTVKTKIPNEDVKSQWYKMRIDNIMQMDEDIDIIWEYLEGDAFSDAVPTKLYNALDNLRVVMGQEWRKL